MGKNRTIRYMRNMNQRRAQIQFEKKAVGGSHGGKRRMVYEGNVGGVGKI